MCVPRSDSKRSPRLAARALVPVLLIGLAACGGGGGGYGGGSTMNTSPPTVTIAFNAATVALGQSATLTWSSTGATACTASGAWTGAQPTSGSSTITPTAAGSATYTLTCSGSYGSTPESATLAATGPSNGPYSLTALVADSAGTAALTVDHHLVNPWGLVMAPGAPVWVANNGSQTSTLYDGNGKAQPTGTPLVVNFAPGAGGVPFGPTGVAYYGGAGFIVSSGAASGSASFIYAGEGGMIAGWSEAVDPLNAITVYTDAGGAVYKGLTLASNATGTFLFATDFHNGKIDVFNSSFHKQTPTASQFAFSDPAIPAGYAPFGIQAINNGAGGAAQLYVTYAKQVGPANLDSSIGAGLGIVDVFDANGTLVSKLVPAGGALNSPWGVALAPSDFGALAGDLLVGNLGDGTINAYDAATGKFVAALSSSSGQPVTVAGLWGIAFGNDSANQPHNTLFYTAGPNAGANGAYGRIDVGSTPPALNQAPVVTITAPVASGGGYGGGATSLSGTVAVTAKVTDSVSVASVQFFAGTTSIGTATTTPYTVQWNTTTSANGSVALTAKATDEDGNVGTSAKDTVTVSNGAAPPPASTLSELQSQIFGPICSGCHNGVGTSLPGVQNLTSAAHTYASLVNVASIEQPSLDRVKPNDPANSYVIQKLEGAAGISGSRMPLGGPYLSSAQISMIESWISAGAPNN